MTPGERRLLVAIADILLFLAQPEMIKTPNDSFERRAKLLKAMVRVEDNKRDMPIIIDNRKRR